VWDLVQKFDFEQRSLIKVELDYVRNTCNSISNGAGTKFLWLHLAVMGFSIAYMILTFNYFLSIMNRFRHIRELHKLKFRKNTPYSSSSLAAGDDEYDTLDEDDVEILKQSY
jgi:hypothetical protein